MTPTPRPEQPAGPVSEQPHALVGLRGHALIVTMNRPHARNALTGPMMAIMKQAWDRVDSDPDVRVCVLTGAGGAFCAGADLKAMTASHPGEQFASGTVDLSVIEPLLKGRRLQQAAHCRGRGRGDRGRHRDPAGDRHPRRRA